jgi:O-antigen ligase
LEAGAYNVPQQLQRHFWILSILFVVANTYAIISGETWISSLPFVFGGFMLIFFNLELSLLLLSLMVPLSVNFEDVGFGLGISLPDEPMIMLIMFLALFKIFIKSEYDARVFKHPITIAILLNLAWLIITTVSSEMPLVSFKYVLSRFWYILVFYFMTIMLFMKRKQIDNYLWLHMASLALVVVITMYKHYLKGFSKDASYEVMQPFYVAHGIYAAALAFFLPMLFIVMAFGAKMKLANSMRWIAGLLFLLFSIGIVFSFTRAAWISVLALLGLIVPLLLRIRFNQLLMLVAAGGVIFLLFKNDIYYALSKTQEVSSNDISVHLKSVSNVKSDASNAERINRWMSAIEMFKEKPHLGFGPGTYMFTYAPYQQFNYETIISTNFGDVGNAHSEYLGMLSEAGWPGLLTLLLIIYVFLHASFRLYYRGFNQYVRYMALSVMLGLTTYLVHGTMNNYMESDKIAVLWWGSMAIITAMDLYHNRQESE